MKNDKTLRDEELEQNIIDLVIMIAYTIFTFLDIVRQFKKPAKTEEKPAKKEEKSADGFESMP